MPKVALVDDDAVLRFVVGSALRQHTMHVFECESAEALFNLLQKQKMDVIILDLILPQINGFDALTYLRAQSDVGVIMISSYADTPQRLDGLRKGADDFISKPILTDELVLKVKSLTARVNSQRGCATPQSLSIGNCQLIAKSNILVNHEQKARCDLTDSEQRILISLIQHGSQVCSRKLLLQCINRYELALDNHDRSLNTLVSRLRNKMNTVACTVSITAIRGQGYRLQHV